MKSAAKICLRGLQQSGHEEGTCAIRSPSRHSISFFNREKCCLLFKELPSNYVLLTTLTTGEINIHRMMSIVLKHRVQCQEALDRCRSNKSIIGETNRKQLTVLQEMSSWCLQDLGTKMNRTKIETLVTIQAIFPSQTCCYFAFLTIAPASSSAIVRPIAFCLEG